MTFRDAFLDFPADALPTNLAELGLEDVSYRNDACPSFRNAFLRLIVFVDYPEPASREFPEASRFTLYTTDNAGGINQDFPSIESNDWADIEAHIHGLRGFLAQA